MYNSITGLAKNQLDSWTEELGASNQWLRRSVQRDLFAFLNKRETLCTPGFLLRRHIQANFPDLLREAERRSGITEGNYPNLTKSGNVPWPNPLTRSLAKVLSEHVFPGYGHDRLGIDSRQWSRYLEEQGLCNRETAIKLVFALDMDDATAAKFMLSNGWDLLSVRNPFDFICKFCLSHTPKRPYEKALALLARFEEGRGNGHAPQSFRYGMTISLNEALQIPETLPTEEAEHQLISYMTAHEGEFSSRHEKKNQKNKPREERTLDYASGFSLQNIRMLKILMKYLAVLYPAAVGLDRDDHVVNIPISTDEDGVPTVYSRLTQAMFELQNIEILDHLELNIPSRGREKLAYDQIPFNDSIVLPLKNLSRTLRAMTRAAEAPANARDVNRSTILLLAYFFITGYQYVPPGNIPLPSDGLEDLLDSDIAQAEEDRDLAAGRILHTLRDVMDILYDAASDPSRTYISCLNRFLLCFSFTEFYPPFVLDRFVLLCLVADPLNTPLEANSALQYLMQLVISESFQLSLTELKGVSTEDCYV